jgi:hypothetical protein
MGRLPQAPLRALKARADAPTPLKVFALPRSAHATTRARGSRPGPSGSRPLPGPAMTRASLDRLCAGGANVRERQATVLVRLTTSSTETRSWRRRDLTKGEQHMRYHFQSMNIISIHVFTAL